MNAFKPAFRPAIRPAITSVFGVQVPVIAPPSLVSQPQSKTVDEYALATFSCEVTGGVAPYSYQWKKNAANVGTNSAALSFTAAATDKNASITVVVTDSAGTSITSTAAVLGVTSYYFKRDGLTQYFALSSYIDTTTGDVIQLDFKATDAVSAILQTLMGGAESGWSTSRVAIQNGALVLTRFSSVLIDGVTKSNGSAIASDGAWHTLKFTIPDIYTLARIRSVGSFFDQRSGSPASEHSPNGIRNFSVTRAGVKLVNNPLNNKSLGSAQVGSVSGINATIANYNAAGWTVI
jgi:hypothetical protein